MRNTKFARFLLRRNSVVLFSMFLLFIAPTALACAVFALFALDRFSRLNFVEGALASGTLLIVLSSVALIQQRWRMAGTKPLTEVITAMGEDSTADSQPVFAASVANAPEPLLLAIAQGPLLNDIYRAATRKSQFLKEVNHVEETKQFPLAA